MRLALKLVLFFMVANIALAIVYGILTVHREVIRFQHRAEAEAGEMGPLLEKLLADAWRHEDDRLIREALGKIVSSQQPPFSIRWVWFDAKPDSEFFPAASTELLTSAGMREHVALEIEEPDGLYLHVYWPVLLTAHRKGGLEFTEPLTELAVIKSEIIQRTALLVGGMLLISGLLAVFLGIRLVGRPLEQLMAKARRIGDGDLEGPVHLRTRDELAELAEDLNAMCSKLAESQIRLRQETAARITAMEQLRHADRLKTVGRLASGIAHELGTPLNVVAGRAGLIGSGKLDAKQVTESASAIKQEADKMTTIIRQLLDFARVSTPRKSPIDLRIIVRQTISMIEAIAEKHKVQLNFASDAPGGPGSPDAAGVDAPIAEADAGQIQQVLTNLTINAIQAMPNGGQVQFLVRRCSARAPLGSNEGEADGLAAFYAIEVRDQGVGIPEDHMQQLFEPFFTTKEVGAGTGLGLSIAYGIVQEHGGWIDVTSQVGEGSCFTVYLPAGAKS